MKNLLKHLFNKLKRKQPHKLHKPIGYVCENMKTGETEYFSSEKKCRKALATGNYIQLGLQYGRRTAV